MEKYHYKLSKYKAQMKLFDTKLKKLQLDKRMVKSALVKGNGLSEEKKIQIQEEAEEAEERAKKAEAFIEVPNYPIPVPGR